jgi:hypothetical protein
VFNEETVIAVGSLILFAYITKVRTLLFMTSRNHKLHPFDPRAGSEAVRMGELTQLSWTTSRRDAKEDPHNTLQ